MTRAIAAVPEKLATWALACALAGLIAAILVLAAVPPVDRDALTHHLAVPKLYLQQGGMVELPAVPFSYYPMNLELLYLVPLYFGNDVLPKYIHFAFALMTSGMIHSYLRRRLGRSLYGVLGALMFLSLPVVVKLSITVYVDLGLIFFATAALLKLLSWARGGLRTGELAAAGVYAGLCLGTKPNGLLAVFLLALFIPFLHRSGSADERPSGTGASPPARRPLESLRLMLVFVAVAGAIYAPWMIRNVVWTGNPIYPFAQRVFGPAGEARPDARAGGETVAAPVDDRGGLGHFSVRRLVFGESLAQILAIPLRIFFQGRDDDPRLFDGRLNPYLLILPLIALVPAVRGSRPRRIDPETAALGGFALLYLLFAFLLTDMRIRYVGPILPALVILACIGVHDLLARLKTVAPRRLGIAAPTVAGVVIAGLLGQNGLYLAGQFKLVDPLSRLTGRLSRDEYILRHRPEYDAISYANRTLPEGARIFALFNGNRIYYSDREMVCDNLLFARLVKSAPAPEGFRAELKRRGITHLLIGIEPFNRWAEHQFGRREKEMLAHLFQECFSELYQGHGYALFSVGGGGHPPGS